MTSVLLAIIADRKTRQRDVADDYAHAMRSSFTIDWPAVNAAIIKRWSMSGLIAIKKKAWKQLNGTGKSICR